MTDIFEKDFGCAFGRRAKLFTLSNGGLTASVTDLGAALVSVRVPDKNGAERNVVLGYRDAAGYAAGTSSLGATVGRYAGRIGGSRFALRGREYRLPPNDGENHLHGGFGKRFFEAETTENGVRFTLESPAGEEGFPGALSLSVLYELDGSALRIVWEAVSDSDTHLNITNHAYFNLDGGGAVGEHLLSVNSDAYAEAAEGLIPTGRLKLLPGSPLDFRAPDRLKRAMEDGRLASTRGLDHSFMIRGEAGKMREAARLFSEKTGVLLICRTTQPTVHVYTAGFLDLDASGLFPRWGGVCLETQHLPDSPNKPAFPSTLLRAGETFREETEYEFFIE
jgi:aldose 1-epimerase